MAARAKAIHTDHHVQFYENDAFLCDAVAKFVRDGLVEGQAVVMVATEEHRQGVGERLQANGHDFEDACQSGRLLSFDAHCTLSKFMVNGMPDENLFRHHVGGIIQDRLRDARSTKVHAYGEMVDILWRAGNASAAIRLEELWNELARKHAFNLLCAYKLGPFYLEPQASYIQDVCDQHAHVIPAESFSLDADRDTQAHQVVRLQQRATRLENEINNRKKLERALRDALVQQANVEAELIRAKEDAERASRVKSDFLAIMSHELRTPLNVIIGYQDILIQQVGGPVTEAQSSYLGRIRAGAEQLLTLIDQVLSLSRIEAGKEELAIQDVDIGELVRDTAALVEPIAAKKGLALSVTQSEGDVAVRTDASKVRQILLNLLSNAVKFTHTGTISVSVSHFDGWASIEVADTGIGIDASNLPRVFEPFVQLDASVTREHGGTGLGLAVSYDLARLLGGDLLVRSAIGNGAVFTLRLPRPSNRH